MHKIHHYHAYGLEIHSEVSIPELPEGGNLPPDVMITYGKPPMFLEGPKTVSRKYEARERQLLIKTDKIARILVSNGTHIMVDPLPGAQEHQVRLLLMGWGLGALFQQRNTVTLHGSVICKAGKAFVICASSGVGKSTMAVAFIHKGYQYLDDNLAVFSPFEETPIVLPGYPQIKLWEDTLEKFNIEKSINKPLFPDIQKYQISFMDQFYPNSAPVQAIYILKPSNQVNLSLMTLTGHKSFKMLLSQVFCRQFISDLSQSNELFSGIIKIANQTSIVLVSLPEPRCEPENLVEFIEKDINFQITETKK